MYSRRVICGLILTIFFLCAGFSRKDFEAQAEIREPYLFVISGPLIAMIIGIAITAASSDYDPKIREIKPLASDIRLENINGGLVTIQHRVDSNLIAGATRMPSFVTKSFLPSNETCQASALGNFCFK